MTEPVWRQIFRNSSCLAMLPGVAGIVGILLAITLGSELFRVLFFLLCLVLFQVLVLLGAISLPAVVEKQSGQE